MARAVRRIQAVARLAHFIIMIDLLANVDFALASWLLYTMIGGAFMWTPGADCCGEPAIPCQGCSDEWSYPDSSDINTVTGDGSISDEATIWANDGTGGGGELWVNPSNAANSDDAYATVVLNSNFSRYLKGTGFQFSLPESATIVGIEVDIEWSRVGDENVTLDSVKLVVGGTIVGNELAAGEIAPGTDTVLTLGGPTELAGLSLTYIDVNDPGFGVALKVASAGTNETARIDVLGLTVYYEGATGCGFVEMAGSWSVATFRLTTSSANALALATFQPDAVDFFALFPWAIGNAGDELRFVFNWVDFDNYTYIEIKASDPGTSDGHIKIINIISGTPSELASVTDTDLGAPFISAGVEHTVHVCITPSIIYVEALGVCLRAVSPSMSGLEWGFATGVTTGTPTITSVMLQENGLDGDGNPCGCAVACGDCGRSQVRIDMEGWTGNDPGCDCSYLNTAIYLDYDCYSTVDDICDLDPEEHDHCLYTTPIFLEQDCEAGAPEIGFVGTGGSRPQTQFVIRDTSATFQMDTATSAEPNVHIYLFTSTDTFDRDADCNGMSLELPFDEFCSETGDAPCDHSGVTVTATAIS